MGLSKTASICQSCPKFDNCNSKMMESCATIEIRSIEYEMPYSSGMQGHVGVDAKLQEKTVMQQLQEEFTKQLERSCFKSQKRWF